MFELIGHMGGLSAQMAAAGGVGAAAAGHQHAQQLFNWNDEDSLHADVSLFVYF
jgi:hypothetical protein